MSGRKSRGGNSGKVMRKHGPVVLAALYRYGALTLTQLMRVLGMQEWQAREQLNVLRKNGLVDVVRDANLWAQNVNGRAVSVYHLVGQGMVAGAEYAQGLDYAKAAKARYMEIGWPVLRSANHRTSANEYLLAVAEAGAAAGLDVPWDSLHSETAPYFPLYSESSAGESKSAAPHYAPIHPDGVFEVEAEGSAWGYLPYFVELELRWHVQELTRKLVKYVQRQRRLLHPVGHEVKFYSRKVSVEPVVLLSEDEKLVSRARRLLPDRIRDGGPQLMDYTRAERVFEEAAARREGVAVEERRDAPLVSPLHMIMVGSLTEAVADPLGEVYTPLQAYPEGYGGDGGDGRGRVSLLDAADLSAWLEPVPQEQLDAEKEAIKKGSDAKKEVS